MPENKLIEPIKELLRIYQEESKPESYPEDVLKIQVDRVVSKIAFVYEKVRNAVQYHEEHLLRRNAIERILRRRFSAEDVLNRVARPLICELIRARYLENNFYPEGKAQNVANIIEKYIALMNAISTKVGSKREQNKMYDWLLSVASCEIEEELIPQKKEKALVDCMYTILNDDIVFKNIDITQSERDIQVYIAINRTLLKASQEILRFRLLNLYYPDWHEADRNLIDEVATNFEYLHDAIDKEINRPMNFYLQRTIKKYSVFFMILQDVILRNSNTSFERISDSLTLEQNIKEACEKRYKEVRSKLNRSTIRSVAYIFITKMSLAFVIEVPYDLFILKQLNYLPLAINIIFHPLLMFFLTAIKRPPDDRNTIKIIHGIKDVVYSGHKGQIVFKVKESYRRGSVSHILFNIFYLIMFVVSFGLIVYILYKLKFNIVSGSLFLLFLSIVSFFSVRIGRSVKELNVTERKENLFTFLEDFISVPIIRAGRWMSLEFSKINIFVFLLDFVIEAPFKMVVDVIEQLFAFIKEKKEEVE